MRRALSAALLIGAAAAAVLDSSTAQAQIVSPILYVRAGDTGSVSYPIAVDFDSGDSFYGAYITVTSSASVNALPSSIADIRPGQTRSFSVSYSIDSAAGEGSLSALFTPGTAGTDPSDISPPLAQHQFETLFSVDNTPPSASASDSTSLIGGVALILPNQPQRGSGYSTGDGLSITFFDYTANGSPTGSGIDQVIVENADGIVMAPTYPGDVQLVQPLPGLSEGQYTITGVDLAGNETAVHIGVDKTPPVISAQDSEALILSGAAAAGTDVSIDANDPGTVVSGLAKLEIYKGDPDAQGLLLAQNTDAYPSQHTYTSADAGLTVLAELPESPITIRVTDAAGNKTKLSFNVSRGPQVGLTDIAPGAVTPPDGPNYFIGMGIYEGVQGDLSESANIPTTLPPAYPGNNGIFFALFDPYGIASASIAGPLHSESLAGETGTLMTANSISGYWQPLDSEGHPLAFPPGEYTLTTANSIGVESIVPFKVAKITAATTLVSGSYDPDTGAYNWTMKLDFGATEGLAEMDEFFGMNLTPPVRTLSGTNAEVVYSKSGVTLTQALSEQTGRPLNFGEIAAQIIDADGNSIEFFAPGQVRSQSMSTPIVIPNTGTQFEIGSYPPTPLGSGVIVSNMEANDTFDLELGVGPPVFTPPGWKAAVDKSYVIFIPEGVPPVTLSMPVPGAADGSLVRIAQTTGFTGPINEFAAVVTNGMAVVSNLAETGILTPIVPVYPAGALLSSSAGEFIYNTSGDPGLTLADADAGSGPLRTLVLSALQQGLVPDGPLVELGPEHTSLHSPGYLTLAANSSNDRLLELSTGQDPRPLGGTYSRYGSTKLTGAVSRIDSYFGAFKTVDVVAPRTTIQFNGAASTSAAVVIDSTTFVGFSATDPVIQDRPTSGVAATYFLLDQPFVSMQATPPSTFTAAFTLSPGTHLVTCFSADNAGNQEAPKTSSVTVLTLLAPDQTPPVTTLGFSGVVSTDSSGAFYIPENAPLSLSAADAFVNGAATSGLLASYYLIDQPNVSPSTAAFQTYFSTFTLFSGTHTVAYFSVDHAGNQEAAVTAAVNVDAGPPATSLQVLGSSATDSFGRLVFSSSAFVALSAVDPPFNGVASGVGSIFYVIDADPDSPACEAVALDTSAPNGTCANELYAGPFSLSVGTHTLYFSAEDNVGNQETTRLISVNVTAPVIIYVSTSADGLATITSRRSDAAVVAVSTSANFSASQAALNQGLQLIGSLYNLTPGLTTFSPSATLGRILSFAGLDAANTALYAYNGTSWSSAAITGQQYLALSSVSVQLSGSVTQTSLIGAFKKQAADVLPPRTTLNVGDPNYFTSTSTVYVGDPNSFYLTASDDRSFIGDNAGTVARTMIAVDTTVFSNYQVIFSLNGEGSHSISFYSLDTAGNQEAAQTTTVGLDLTPPNAFVEVRGSSTTDADGNVTIASSGTAIAILAEDPVVNGVASGVDGIFYLVDANPRSQACRNTPFDGNAPNGTCANPQYAGAFTLAVGTHTLFYVAQDKVENQNDPTFINVTVLSGYAAPPSYQINPATGPVGIPFSIAGSGFGSYAGGNTVVKFGTASAPLSAWNDANISGSVPGLSTGTYAVTIERQNISSTTILSAGSFTVLQPAVSTLTPTSGPIGTPFALNGASFGPYAGGQTRVLFDGKSAPLSAWSDTSVAGSVPSLVAGSHAVWLERATSDGWVTSSATSYFTVTAPAISTIAPTSGPIGAGFTISGQSFGSYAGGQTQVIFGGASASLSAWNDTAISGTVPGSLTPGNYPVYVQRTTPDGGLAASNTVYFQVAGLALASFSPSTGPIGIAFTLTGAGFGAYGGGNTLVLIGGVTAALSAWNDTTISGTIPALPVGTYSVVAERLSGSGTSVSAASTFTVTDLVLTAPSPSTAPAGAPFTLTGTGFGAYGGGTTRLLVGGAPAALSVWNDTTISGVVPFLPAGPAAVWIERTSGTGLQSSNTVYLQVSAPGVDSFSPASGPIGAPWTISGSGFGPYGGGNTRVTFNGVAAPLSAWSDASISGTVPGALSTGAYVVVVERAVGSDVVQSATQAFTVVAPNVDAMTPTWGPVGTGVQLTGTGFGPYGGGWTQVLLGGTAMPLSVWNDTTIVWTVPSGTADGAYSLVVQRSPPGGTVQSASMTFTVGATAPSSLRLGGAAPAARPDWHFAGELLLSTGTGGHIQSPSLAGVQVPPGALDAATVVTMARGRDLFKNDRLAALGHDGLGAAGEAISYGPEGTRFATPVTLELPYDAALVPDDKVADVAIHYYDPTAKAWTPLVTRADTTRHVLTAQTNHFSLYQALGHGIGVAAADASFGFKAVYVFPNPVRGVNAATFRVQPGAADSVEVNVYDAAGRKAYSSSNFTNRGAFDDGNGLGAQFTYENVWDISGIGSGVYNYIITAKQAGQKDIRKSGKVGVVK